MQFSTTTGYLCGVICAPIKTLYLKMSEIKLESISAS